MALRFCSVALCMVAPSLAASAQASSASKAAADLLARGFSQQSSAGLVITHNVSDAIADSLVGEFEKTRVAVVAFARELGFVEALEQEPVHVVLFQSQAEYAAYARAQGMNLDGSAGFCAHESDLILLWKVDPQPALELTLRHETAHKVLYRLGVHRQGSTNPPWLVEGLACLFEVPQPGDEINRWRLTDLLSAMEDGNAAASRPSNERVLPIAELIANPALFSTPTRDQSLLYAQSWALVYYLHATAPGAFADYLRRIAQRSPGLAVGPEGELVDFIASFGRPEAEFERRWQAGVRALRAVVEKD